MLKATAVAALMLGVLGIPRSDAQALLSDQDRIVIHALSVPGCGNTSVTVTGTGEYSDPVQHLIVTLDGVQILHSHSEPETWSAGPVAVGEGTHTVTAVITDDLDHEEVMAQQTRTFTVSACGGGQVSTAGAGASSADCCPGSDPVAPKSMKAAKKGAVKSAAATKLPRKLQPLNDIFRKVHGRSPTFTEWQYWSGRLLNDKPQFDALYGAIQWHELRGHTVGDPVPPMK